MSHRINKINDEIKRALSDLIPLLKDPRVSGVPLLSVCSVSTAADLALAKIYVSVMGSDQQKEQAIDGLSAAAGFLRRELGKSVRLRACPELKFILDNSIEYGAHINAVLKNLGDTD